VGTEPENSSRDLDLSPYAGRWVALVRGRVAGVGRTADEARHAAQAARPKEKSELRFVTVNDWQALPLVRRLWEIIQAGDVEALLVGGAVRDGLLGRPLHDLDFVVAGDVAPLAAAVSRALRGALVLMDPERDIFRVVARYNGQRFGIDFARRQGDSWDADLHARDFTVNAIAVDAAGRYLDPLGGRDDLAAGRLRAASEGAFRADPLRTLRAVRLVAELGLVIEPETLAWIRRDAPLLPPVAAERIRDEFVRVLGAPGAARHLSTLDDLGLLAQVLPEVKTTQGVGQSPPHQWGVWAHTRRVVEAVERVLGWVEENGGMRRDVWELESPGWVWGDLDRELGPLRAGLAAHLSRVVSDTRDRRFILKLSALLHDVGKPLTRSVGDDGRVHFYQHESVGADLAVQRCQALRFSGDEIALVRTIVLHHLRPGHLAGAKKLTRRAVYRYFKATGEAGVEVGLLSLADMLATWGPALPSRHWLRRLDVVGALLSAFFDQSEVVAPPPLINGRDLMATLELVPGPEVGRLLEAVREAQAAGEVKTREAALALAAKLKREA
jgi:tRNA nucleotidyltransferase/poly(A) polymerase